MPHVLTRNEGRIVGIGKTLDRVFADKPGDQELIGHPIRIWRQSSKSQKLALLLTLALQLIAAAFLIFTLWPLLP